RQRPLQAADCGRKSGTYAGRISREWDQICRDVLAAVTPVSQLLQSRSPASAPGASLLRTWYFAIFRYSVMRDQCSFSAALLLFHLVADSAESRSSSSPATAAGDPVRQRRTSSGRPMCGTWWA